MTARPSRRTYHRSATLVLALAALSACVETAVSDPTVTTPMYSDLAVPIGEIFEDEPMLAVGAQLETFGGYYFGENGELVVALTDVADLNRAIPLIRPWLGANEPKAYRAEEVRHSFYALAAFRTLLMKEVWAVEGVVSLGVRESLNRIVVGTRSSSSASALEALFFRLGMESDMAIVEVRGMAEQTDTLRQSDPDSTYHEGGWGITVYNHDKTISRTCTVGFAAIRATGGAGYVTNSHCTAIQGLVSVVPDTMFQPRSGWVRWGYELVDPPMDLCYDNFMIQRLCRDSDAAFFLGKYDSLGLAKIVRTTGSSGAEDVLGSRTFDSSNPFIAVTSRANHTTENETLHKIGASSGWTYGDVEDTCTDESIDGTIIYCSDRIDFTVRPGDSGSPVFYLKGDGTAELRGIVWGRTMWISTWDGVISDLYQVEKDLGGLIVTDEPVTASIISGGTDAAPNAVCQWAGEGRKGWPPYDFEWRVDGVFVSDDPGYVMSPTPSSGQFSLSFTVTDYQNESDTETWVIDIDQSQSGQFICNW